VKVQPAQGRFTSCARSRNVEAHNDGVRRAHHTAGEHRSLSAGLVTKTSCPFVYVDRGDGFELVGEAYSGAALRSIERDDMLPIPDFPNTPRVHLRLGDEAHETQFTNQRARASQRTCPIRTR
jgi:hypothetical protein